MNKKKLIKYKIVLSEQGKKVFRGGNVEVMKKMLFSFEAESDKKAEGIFDKELRETMGSASEFLYEVKRLE